MTQLQVQSGIANWADLRTGRAKSAALYMAVGGNTKIGIADIEKDDAVIICAFHHQSGGRCAGYSWWKGNALRSVVGSISQQKVREGNASIYR